MGLAYFLCCYCAAGVTASSKVSKPSASIPADFFLCGLTNSGWLNWLLHLRPVLRPRAMVRINAYGLPLIFLPFCMWTGVLRPLWIALPSLVAVICTLAAGQFVGHKLIAYVADVRSGRRSTLLLKSVLLIAGSFMLNFGHHCLLLSPLLLSFLFLTLGVLVLGWGYRHY